MWTLAARAPSFDTIFIGRTLFKTFKIAHGQWGLRSRKFNTATGWEPWYLGGCLVPWQDLAIVKHWDHYSRLQLYFSTTFYNHKCWFDKMQEIIQLPTFFWFHHYIIQRPRWYSPTPLWKLLLPFGCHCRQELVAWGTSTGSAHFTNEIHSFIESHSMFYMPNLVLFNICTYLHSQINTQVHMYKRSLSYSHTRLKDSLISG